MASRDLKNNIGVATTLVPAVQAATLKGNAVDLKGFESATLIINTGAAVGAGLFDVKLQESDTTTDGDFTDVAAANLIGSLPASLAENMAYKQGYTGGKRYVRAVITKQSGTSIAAGAVIVKGHPHSAPAA